MRIFSFYSEVPDLKAEDELRLILLWRFHHQQMGLEPVVLNEWHARQSPHFEEYDKAISRLPSVNPSGYDRACYLRWLAVSWASRQSDDVVWMMDYDTFIVNDYAPLKKAEGGLTVYQNTTPCLVSGMSEDFLEACRWFSASVANPPVHQVNGKKHLSDMILLEAIATKAPATFARKALVKCYGEEGWADAVAVHFSNSCMTPAGKLPRWRTIPDLILQANLPKAI